MAISTGKNYPNIQTPSYSNTRHFIFDTSNRKSNEAPLPPAIAYELLRLSSIRRWQPCGERTSSPWPPFCKRQCFFVIFPGDTLDIFDSFLRNRFIEV